MEIPPSLIQASIPSTFSAPTLTSRVLHTTTASTITSISIQTTPLYISTLLGSTIQTDVLYGSTVIGNNIGIITLSTSSLVGSTIQADTLFVSSLTGSTIRTNTLYISSGIGSTIQTNTYDTQTILGSTIQSNTLITSTITGNIIQTNTQRASTLIGSTIQTNILRVSTLLGSTIQSNTLKVSTILGSTVQHNQLNTNITIGSTLYANVFQPTTLQLSTLLGSTLQTNTANMSTLRLLGSTFQTNNFNFNTITGSTIQTHAVNISTLLGNILIGCTIQANAVSCSTILGNTIQGNQLNVSTLIGNTSQIKQGTISTIRCSTLIGSTFQTNQINVSTITASTIQDNIIQMSSLIGSTIQISTLSISSLIGSTIQTSTLRVSTLTGSTIQSNTLQVSTLTGSTITATQLNIGTLVCSTLEMDRLDGSTILYSTIQTNTLSISTIRSSTIIGSTVQTDTLQVSSISCSTMIGSVFNINKILTTDGNKTLATSDRDAAHLAYLTNLTSQAGGINQANTWTATQTFSTIDIYFPNLSTETPAYLLGLTASNKLIKYPPGTSFIQGTLTSNYIPYASGVSTLTNSIIYRVNATDIAIGQTTSTFPTGTGTTLTIAGQTQATSIIAGTGTFSKIVMPDKRTGLNGLQIPGSNGCNFYMGTMNNNNSGNYTDTLYLNSAATFDMTDSFNVRNNIVVTTGGTGFETMPSFTPSSTALTFSALFICTGSTMPSTWARIFDIGNTTVSGASRGFLIAFHNSNVLWADYRQADGTVTSMSTSIQLRLNTIYHVVWTISSSGSHVLYINGEQAATMTKVITFDTLPYFYLGKSNWSNDGYPNMTIFDFRMINRSLSLPDVHALYYNLKYVSVSSITQGPIFDTSSSFNVTNNVAVSSAGTGFATLPSFTPSSTALTFSILLICTGSSMPAQYSRIFDVGNLSQAPSRNFGIRFDASNTITAYYTTSATTAFLQTSSIVLRLNTVYHIAWTISSAGTHTLYINGNQTATMTQIITLDTLPYFYLGKSLYSGDPYPNMIVYDFRMMNQTLSATEVNSLQYFLKNTYVTSVISGQYIVLNRPYSGDLNLAEIQVFSYPGGPNIITPSTSVSYANVLSGYPTSNFVDGRFDTIMHNDGTLGGPITINLGSTQPIYKIIIYNRLDCCWNRANGIVLTIQNSNNTVIYTSSPIPDKLGRTTAMLSETSNLTDYYYTFTYFPPYAAVIGDFEKIADPCNVNVVMFNKGTPGMRIYQGTNGAPNNYTTYKDLAVTDANSGNITLGQNSDTNGITFGPNATWSSYLKVGSGTNRIGTNTAQVISTNGNLHIDSATNTRSIYLNHYAKQNYGTGTTEIRGNIYMPSIQQQTDIYALPITIDRDGTLRKGQLVQRCVYRNNSVGWGGGVNVDYAFYNYSIRSQVLISGKMSYWVDSPRIAYPYLRLGLPDGNYWYFSLQAYTNNGGNHVTFPFQVHASTSRVGWHSIYIYNNGSANTDGNDQLWINVTTFPSNRAEYY